MAAQLDVTLPRRRKVGASSKVAAAETPLFVSEHPLLSEEPIFASGKHFAAVSSSLTSDIANVNGGNKTGEHSVKSNAFNYELFCNSEIDRKLADSSYRVFNNINRLAARFPHGHTAQSNDIVAVWCSNDYLGMSRHPKVVKNMKAAVDRYGAGAGGTRNIAGNAQLHLSLEASLADLHSKPAALVFSSCFVANDATLSTLASRMPGCVIFSDASNHASMIQGIKNSRAKKFVFRHNDVNHLEELLKSVDYSLPKIIAFESVYSMCGSIGPIREICDLVC